jgi:hypothetical protein
LLDRPYGGNTGGCGRYCDGDSPADSSGRHRGLFHPDPLAEYACGGRFVCSIYDFWTGYQLQSGSSGRGDNYSSGGNRLSDNGCWAPTFTAALSFGETLKAESKTAPKIKASRVSKIAFGSVIKEVAVIRGASASEQSTTQVYVHAEY